jgi:hypothetical protein
LDLEKWGPGREQNCQGKKLADWAGGSSDHDLTIIEGGRGVVRWAGLYVMYRTMDCDAHHGDQVRAMKQFDNVSCRQESDLLVILWA